MSYMGTKNKPLSSQDRQGAKSKSKKAKTEGGVAKAEITVMLNEEQALKVVRGAKVITVQELARQTGVKISAANAFLRQAVQKGTVNSVGGYSGHRIYQPAS